MNEDDKQRLAELIGQLDELIWKKGRIEKGLIQGDEGYIEKGIKEVQQKINDRLEAKERLAEYIRGQLAHTQATLEGVRNKSVLSKRVYADDRPSIDVSEIHIEELEFKICELKAWLNETLA